jgi:Integrase zinc binding domain
MSKWQELDTGITVHEGLIRKEGQIYVGHGGEWRSKMIQSFHDSNIDGHSRILGTYQRVRKFFYWPKLKDTILQHVQHCEVCQLNKGETVACPRLLEPIHIPDNALEVITMDFITGLPKSGGKDVLMVIIDKFTNIAIYSLSPIHLKLLM